MPTLQELIDAARKEKDQLAERFGFNGPSSLDVVSAAAKRAASKKREASKANKRARESSEPMSPHRRSSRLSGAEPSPLSYGDVEDSDADSDDTDELELSLPRVRKPKVAKPSASASFTAPVSSALSGKEAALVELRMSLPKYPGRNNEAYNSLSFKGRISGCHWHRHKTVDLKPMCGLCAKPSNLYCEWVRAMCRLLALATDFPASQPCLTSDCVCLSLILSQCCTPAPLSLTRRRRLPALALQHECADSGEARALPPVRSLPRRLQLRPVL